MATTYKPRFALRASGSGSTMVEQVWVFRDVLTDGVAAGVQVLQPDGKWSKIVPEGSPWPPPTIQAG